MKPKFKGVSGTAIKSWFFAHGEKLAFGVATLLAALLIYRAIGREVLPSEKEPSELAAIAARANDHLRASKWDGQSLSSQPYVERARRDDVVAVDYRLRTFDRPIYDVKAKRGDPTILAAEELRAAAGHGIMAVLPKGADGALPALEDRNPDIDNAGPNRIPGVRPPAGSVPEGRYWAVVTGLIPIKKQLVQYQREFQRAKAVDPAADVPVHLRFAIERATIDPDFPDVVNWQLLKISEATAFASKWAITAREIVAPNLVNPNFTMKLGPLLGQDWGPEVTHPMLVAVPAPTPQSAAPMPPDDDPFGDNRIPSVQPKPPVPGPVPQGVNKPVEYQLFRFFDFTVEPGKQYRYRIMLGLKNPNFKVLARYLKNPEISEIQFVKSPISEPTPIVFIPRAEQILAGGRSGDRPTIAGEPETTIMLTTLDRELGAFASKVIRVMRGTLTNFAGKVVVKDEVSNKPKELNIKFSHNCLVLDIRGGRELPGREKMTTPMEVLLLDLEGNVLAPNEILARDEITDAEAFKLNQSPLLLTVPAPPGPRITDPPARPVRLGAR